MIHREFCNPLKTKDYSALRIQFNFLLSRYVCWDGLIPLTRQEMASMLSCNIQSINKFIKKGIREGILSYQGDRLFLLQKVEHYNQGYIKHYPFLESSHFYELSIHAQRFVLYALWAGVHTGRPLKRDISTLYHSTSERCGVLNLYFKAPVYAVLEESAKFLKLEVVYYKGKEVVRVTGLHECWNTEEALDNQGEFKFLEMTLEHHQCDELVSVQSRQEILKIKKHYVSTLNSIGLELFSHALKKLLSLHKLYELDIRGEVGVYLKAILNDLEQKILPTIEKRIVHTQQAINSTKDIVINSTSYYLNLFKKRVEELTNTLDKLVTKHKKSITNKIVQFPLYNWLEVE